MCLSLILDWIRFVTGHLRMETYDNIKDVVDEERGSTPLSLCALLLYFKLILKWSKIAKAFNLLECKFEFTILQHFGV
ncbi:hypothetical protein MTR_8g103350 [Medicago truncatula]|uniref:Uncharacterized protein n=1 Tax=Medicago truncatula TaxID=3880 RepID=G7L887_MEDTR|nr:hypothetical protein MTR_8g103350 [Medicago truncatula]